MSPVTSEIGPCNTILGCPYVENPFTKLEDLVKILPMNSLQIYYVVKG